MTKSQRILTSSVLAAGILMVALALVLLPMPRGTHADSGTVAQWEGNPNEDVGLAPSRAQLDEMLAASLPGPGYLVLPPAAFTWDGYISAESVTGMFIMRIVEPDAGYFTGQVATNACLVAPVQLPQGVEITGIEVRLQDSNDGPAPAGVEWFRLLRTSITSGVVQRIAEVVSPEGTTGGLVGLRDLTVENPIVDNLYTYQVATCARQNILVYGVRVGYTYSVALPLITR